MEGQLTGLHDLRRPSTSRCLQRRRRVLVGLVIVALITFVLALVASPRIWGIHLVADVAVVAYVAVLIHFRNAAAGTEMTQQALRG